MDEANSNANDEFTSIEDNMKKVSSVGVNVHVIFSVHLTTVRHQNVDRENPNKYQPLLQLCKFLSVHFNHSCSHI